MNRMNGKIAIVTSGRKGIGETIANFLARSGPAGIITCSRHIEKVMEVADYIRTEISRPMVLFKTELNELKNCKSFVFKADEIFGLFDFLLTRWPSPNLVTCLINH